MATMRALQCKSVVSKPSAAAAFGVPRPQAVSRRLSVQVAAIGGPPQPSGERKRFIKREEEPEQYWQSKGEAEGGNVFKDPLAIVGVVAIFFPFVLLLIAGSTGLIDFSVYKGQ